MRRLAVLLLLAACSAGAPPSRQPAPPPAARAGAEVASEALPPSLLYPGLFEAVATSDLFEPKNWVDATPRGTPDEVMAAWRAAGAPAAGPDLAAFARDWFDPPAEVAVALDLPEGRTLGEHVELLWPVLTRAQAGQAQGSLLPLPEPYIVPGGRFREVYYWDAYFTMTGLGPEHDAIKRDMVANFAGQVADHGHVLNGNRTYYLSRSQPPFLHAMVGLLDEDDPAAAYAEWLDTLVAERDWWRRARAGGVVGGVELSRYHDDRDVPRDESYRYDAQTARRADRPEAGVYRDLRAGAESGWDYSSRWLADGEALATIETSRVLPVDLNAILYGLETAITLGCARAGEPCEEVARSAEARAEVVRTAMWSDGLGAFVDLDLDGTRRERLTAATVYPLFFGAASQDQADRVAETIRASLLAPGGLLTTTANTGEQWDAPNGWAPLQWLAVIGLERYGHTGLAHEVARRWATTVARGYCESGKLVEKYDVVTAREGGGGEYPTQDGFGWTNGVTMALIRRDERLLGLADVPAMPETPERCEAGVAAALR